MSQVTEAIYSQGVLKPVGDLKLGEQQRVRIVVQTIDEAHYSREDALRKLRAGIESMSFVSDGHLPGRNELHDRS